MMKFWEARLLAARVGCTVMSSPYGGYRILARGGDETSAPTPLAALMAAYALADEAVVADAGRVA